MAKRINNSGVARPVRKNRLVAAKRRAKSGPLNGHPTKHDREQGITTLRPKDHMRSRLHRCDAPFHVRHPGLTQAARALDVLDGKNRRGAKRLGKEAGLDPKQTERVLRRLRARGAVTVAARTKHGNQFVRRGQKRG